MILHCFVKVGSLTVWEVGLVHTPSTVTYELLGYPGRPWQDIAKDYLAWVADQAAQMKRRDPSWDAKEWVKGERRRLGQAWRMAQERDGRLEFYAM